jgi:hypothetical protein
MIIIIIIIIIVIHLVIPNYINKMLLDYINNKEEKLHHFSEMVFRLNLTHIV